MSKTSRFTPSASPSVVKGKNGHKNPNQPSLTMRTRSWHTKTSSFIHKVTAIVMNTVYHEQFFGANSAIFIA
ncbi:MAG: hypothetical protein OWR52_09620 [Acidibacillus sp.]|nr:hypothetical protein [Acidibacillus sp.]